MHAIPTWLRAATLALALCGAASGAVQAQAPSPENALKRRLIERLPELAPIDEVTRSPMPGLYEVRSGTSIFYTDAQGQYLIQGELWDTQKKRNLTSERLDKLTAIDFASLPLADAITIVKGNGKRRLALFQDPNCGYCKRFERDIQTLDNVTIHMFLYPILGPDSVEKSRVLWCAADRAKAWTDWMVRDIMPARAAACDTAALTRNREFGRKHRLTGTPTLVFRDGSRVPGVMALADLDKKLNEIK